MYRLKIGKRAVKALQAAPGADARRIREKLARLADDPDRRDIDAIPLRDRPGFRLRVGGWRVIFRRDDESREIEVLRLGPRSDVYKH